jgi:hypothetical protein
MYHYEIAAYATARNLALQLRQPAIVQRLTMSLGEEQNAGQLLDQVAQPLHVGGKDAGGCRVALSMSRRDLAASISTRRGRCRSRGWMRLAA